MNDGVVLRVACVVAAAVCGFVAVASGWAGVFGIVAGAAAVVALFLDPEA